MCVLASSWQLKEIHHLIDVIKSPKTLGAPSTVVTFIQGSPTAPSSNASAVLLVNLSLISSVMLYNPSELQLAYTEMLSVQHTNILIRCVSS
jgi:hypothetical protein